MVRRGGGGGEGEDDTRRRREEERGGEGIKSALRDPSSSRLRFVTFERLLHSSAT